MGITCVAIYTEADKNTPYVREADQSFKLSDSYLNAKEILEIAKKNNVDAIHPGYGFLSENANFANNVKKAGIKWVGPSANAIKKYLSPPAFDLVSLFLIVKPLLTKSHVAAPLLSVEVSSILKNKSTGLIGLDLLLTTTQFSVSFDLFHRTQAGLKPQ